VTGGDPQVVGNQSSMFAMKIALLRAKRRSVSAGFSYLCIAMHATLAILLVGIYQVMLNFSKAIEGMSVDTGDMEGISQLPTLQFFMSKGGQLQTLGSMVVAMLIMLTIANAVAIKVTEGGHNYKYLFYLGVTLTISGFSLLLVPSTVAGLFNIVPTGP
jgi:archaellum biogenesis protein FlaJ (TadC family)